MRHFILLTGVFLLSSCAVMHNDVLYESFDEDAPRMIISEEAPNAAMAMRGKMMAASAGGARGMVMNDAVLLQGQEYAAQDNASRMVNYTGNISLQSSEPEAVIDTVVQKAKAKGGLITERRNGFVLLQIPVAEFRNFFNYILTLGYVMNKNIFANDITDAFTDNAERLRIAESTLARLQELLARAKSEQEKIALLKEIQRVNEQIEQAKLTEKELLRMAAFSTISLNVRNNTPVPKPIKAGINHFFWFELLPSPMLIGDALKLNVPQNFIETDKSSKKWRAASVLNTEFTAFEMDFGLQGSVDFWANAILEFFKTEYKAELKKEDNFSLIRLQGFQAESQIYYIAILKKSNKKTLKIAKATFQNAEAEKKDSEAILEVLRRVK